MEPRRRDWKAVNILAEMRLQNFINAGRESKFMSSQQLVKKYLLLMTVSALAGSVAVATAQSPNMGGGQQQSPGQQPMPGQTSPGQQQTMPGTGAVGAPNAMPETSMVDQSFLSKTLEDNMAQVQMAQLASEKSPSNDVKQFGQRMVQVHQELDTQLKPVADKLGVNQPKNPSKKDKQEIERMQALSGPDFDTEFLKAMLNKQQTDVKNFNDEAQTAQDPTVQKVAKMDAPVLSQHLQVLEQLAKQHNIPVESKK